MGSVHTRPGLIIGLAASLTLGSLSVVSAQDADATAQPAASASPAATEPPTVAEIAFLSVGSGSGWMDAALAEIERVAEENGIVVTELDGRFDHEIQAGQLRDAVAADRYDGIIIAAIDGSAIMPDLEAAAEKGIKLVSVNQVIGDDFTTADPQSPALSASVLEPPLVRGERLGRLTLMACEDVDPCDVAYFYGVRDSSLDDAVRQGFDSVVDGSTVSIVAEGEGLYLGPDVGKAQMESIMADTPDGFRVVVGADPTMQGAESALSEAGILSQVKIIGYGGAASALQAVAEGRWFGESFGAPATEGRLAIEALIQALDGNDLGGIDPMLELPDQGLITAANVASFTPEWDG